MRNLVNILDFSTKEIDGLVRLASDIMDHPERKYKFLELKKPDFFKTPRRQVYKFFKGTKGMRN